MVSREADVTRNSIQKSVCLLLRRVSLTDDDDWLD